MCVTNFVRRPRPVENVNHESKGVVINSSTAVTISSRPSLITQRLYKNSNGTESSSISSGSCSNSSTSGSTIQAVSLDALASLPSLLKNQPPSATTAAPYGVVCDRGDSSNYYFPIVEGRGNGSNNCQKAKRKRKPQKPGLTAKNNERQFVRHDYCDHAMDDDETAAAHYHAHHDHDDVVDEGDDQQQTDNALDSNPSSKKKRRGGVSVSFPMKLHAVLEQMERDGYSGILSWQPHGRAFKIHKPTEFTEFVMPHYFRQSKLTSFQRQLNLYGFSRLTKGADAGSYYHELFLRGRGGLAMRMKRTKVKGTKYKAASNPDAEPDFYKMPPVLTVGPASTSAPTVVVRTSEYQSPSQISDDSSSDGNGSSTCCSETVTDHLFDSPVSFRAVVSHQPQVQSMQQQSSGTMTLTTTTTNMMPPAVPMIAVTRLNNEMEPIDFHAFDSSSQFEPLPLNQSSNLEPSVSSFSSNMNAPHTAAFPNSMNMMMTMMAGQGNNNMTTNTSGFTFNMNNFGSAQSAACSDMYSPNSCQHFQQISYQTNVAADKVLDAAIDEIFSPDNDGSMEDVLDLDSLWNTTPDTVEGDEQLGMFLDNFLQQGA